jgi:4-hydroxy-tetrahydrodipicolinate synthase
MIHPPSPAPASPRGAGAAWRCPPGVWSATPTPLDDNRRLDVVAVRRTVQHHRRLGVAGLFLAGNCGEGPFLPDDDRRELVRVAVDETAGAMAIAVQVTDNSSARILENIGRAREDGADLAVFAEPFTHRNATDETLLRLCDEVCASSALPLALYNRGRNAAVRFTRPVLEALYRREPIVAVKDSSSDPALRDLALAVKRERPDLILLNGDEFLCRDYADAGYDGELFGGAIYNARYACAIRQAVQAGDAPRAAALDQALAEVNWAVYCRNIECWLAGLKYLMTRLGVFSGWTNHLDYSLSPACRAAIDRLVEEDRIFSPRPWT